MELRRKLRWGFLPPRVPCIYVGCRWAVRACATRPSKAAALRELTSEWGLNLDPFDRHTGQLEIVHRAPALLRHEHLLDESECAALVETQAGNGTEALLYLNYRVNREVAKNSTSSEAAALIDATDLSAASMNSSMGSGFRTQVPPDAQALSPVLARLQDVLGFHGRRWRFAEGAWVRPNRRQVVVRDITTVHYNVGEGVAPHVDGKDITVLICLKSPTRGGRTVFTKERVAVPPVLGAALIYSSKKNLVHFAEPVIEGEKLVLQLLIDCRIRDDEIEVDHTTGQVLS